MKLLFVVTGVGLGHSVRDHTIIQQILEIDKDIKIHVAAFDTAYQYFKDKYPTTKIFGLKLPEEEFNFSLFKTFLKNWNFVYIWVRSFLRLRKLVKQFKPDKIVIDFEPVAVWVARWYNIKHLTLFNYNPFVFNRYRQKNEVGKEQLIETKYFQKTYNWVKGRKIVPTFFSYKRLDSYFLIPPIVRTYPNQLAKNINIMNRLKLKQSPILVMLGGSKLGLELVEGISNVAKDFKEQFIIFGTKDFETENVTSFKFNPDFLEYLKICKGIITLGGHNTLSELLVFKKPALIYPIPNYIEQILNAYSFKIRKIAIVKQLDAVDQKEIKKHLKQFIGKLDFLQKNLDLLKVRRNGAKIAAELILKKTKIGANQLDGDS